MSTQESSIDVVCDLYAQAGNKLREFSEMNRKIQVLLGQIDFNRVINGAPTEVAPIAEVKKTAPKATKVAQTSSKAKKPTSANRSQTPLREVVFNVVKSNKEGLRVADIIKSIKTEGSWTTSGDLSNMVNSTVHGLRKSGFLVRDDAKKTYKTVSGVSL